MNVALKDVECNINASAQNSSVLLETKYIKEKSVKKRVLGFV
jgi:hypothetical protein